MARRARAPTSFPLLLEIYRDTKAIFKANPVDVFTQGTAGEEFSYKGTRSLEDAISQLSDSLHSSYLINYQPNNKEEGGYHAITVDVDAPGSQIHQVEARLLAGGKTISRPPLSNVNPGPPESPWPFC